MVCLPLAGSVLWNPDSAPQGEDPLIPALPRTPLQPLHMTQQTPCSCIAHVSATQISCLVSQGATLHLHEPVAQFPGCRMAALHLTTPALVSMLLRGLFNACAVPGAAQREDMECPLPQYLSISGFVHAEYDGFFVAHLLTS